MNASTYLKNVGKSMGYMAVDIYKDLNPVTSSFLSDAKDFGEDLYSSVQEFKGKAKDMNQDPNSVLGIAKSTVKDTASNILSDLKTGKWYNKQRFDDLTTEAALGDMGFSEDDFNFDWDEDEESSSLDDELSIDTKAEISNSRKNTITNIKSMDRVGQKLSGAIGTSTFKSAQYIGEVNKLGFKEILRVNNKGFAGVTNGIAAVNANISSLVQLGQPITQHINNSATFYSKTTEWQQGVNEKLDSIIKLISPSKQADRERSYNTIDDLLTSTGTLNFSAMKDMVVNNVKDATSMISMFTSMMSPKTISAAIKGNPLGFLIKSGIEALLPQTFKLAQSKLDSSVADLFGGFLSKLKNGNIYTGNSIIDGLLGLITPQSGYKDRMNPGNYTKRKVDWDGKSRRALMTVIPHYLAEIASAVTGHSMQIYDYESGRWVTARALQNDFNSMKRSYANMAGYDYIGGMRSMANNLARSSNSGMNRAQANQFMSEVQTFNERAFHSDSDEYTKILSTPKSDEDKKERLILAAKYGLSPESLQLIDAYNESLKRNGKLGQKIRYSTSLEKGRNSFTNYINSLEDDGSSFLSLFDNSLDFNKYRTTNKDIGTTSIALKDKNNVLMSLKDQYDNNIFFYLQGMYQNLDFFAENFDLLIDQGAFTVESGSTGKRRKAKVKAPTPLTKNFKFTRRKDHTILRNTNVETSIGEEKENPEEEERQAVGHVNGGAIDSAIKDSDKFDPYSAMMRGISTKDSSLRHSNGEALTTDELVKLRKYYQDKVDNKSQKKNEEFDKLIDSYIKAQENQYKVQQGIKSKIKSTQDKLGIGKFGDKLNEFSGNVDQMMDNWIYNNIPFMSALFGEGEVGNKSGGLFSGLANASAKSFSTIKDKLFNGVDANNTEESASGSGLIGVSGGATVPKEDKNKIRQRTGKKDKNGNDIYRFNIFNTLKKLNKGLHKANETIATGSVRAEDKAKEFAEKTNIDDAVKEVNETAKKFIDNTKENTPKKAQEVKEKAKGAAGKIKDTGMELGQAFYNNIVYQYLPKKGDKEKKNIADLISKSMDEAKLGKGSILTGALAGGGLSIVTGAIINPLVGAAIGAGVGLVSKSKTVQDALFGEEVKDESGNAVGRKGGLLGQKISNFIFKNTEGLKHGTRGAAIGGIAGTFLGSPVIGAVVGSTIGFVKNSDQAKEKLFGKVNEDGTRDDTNALIKQEFVKTIKDRKLGIAAGAGLGAAASLLVGGPFGLVGNIMLGSALGFAADNEKFKSDIFGDVIDDKGHRKGGLMGMIKERLVDPLNEMIRNIPKMLAKDMKNIGRQIGSAIYEHGIKRFATAIRNSAVGKKVSNFGSKVYNGVKKVGKKAVNAATFIPYEGRNALRRRALNNNYGWTDAEGNELTAIQRQAMRKELIDAGDKGIWNSVLDEKIAGMSDEQLQQYELLTQINKNPKKLTETLDKQYKQSKQNTFNMFTGFSGVDEGQRNKILSDIQSAASEKDINKIRGKLNNLKGLTKADRKQLNDLLDKQNSALQYKLSNDKSNELTKQYTEAQTNLTDQLNNIGNLDVKTRQRWLNQLSTVKNGKDYDKLRAEIENSLGQNGYNLDDNQREAILRAIDSQRTIFNARNDTKTKLDQTNEALRSYLGVNGSTILNNPEKFDALLKAEIKGRAKTEEGRKNKEKQEAEDKQAININDITKDVKSANEFLDKILSSLNEIKNNTSDNSDYNNELLTDENGNPRKFTEKNPKKRKPSRNQIRNAKRKAANDYAEYNKERMQHIIDEQESTETKTSPEETDTSASGWLKKFNLRLSAGASGTPKNGDTRKNPETGAVEVYSNGKWVEDEESTETNQAQKDKKERSGFMGTVKGFGTGITSIANNMSSLVKGIFGKKEKKKSLIESLFDGAKNLLFGSGDGTNGLLGGLFSFFTGGTSGKGVVGQLLSKFNLSTAISSGLGIGAIVSGVSGLLFSDKFANLFNKIDPNHGKPNSAKGVGSNTSYTGIEATDSEGNKHPVALNSSGKPVKNKETGNYVGTDGKDIEGSSENSLSYTGSTATDNINQRARKSVIRGALTNTDSILSVGVKGIGKQLSRTKAGTAVVNAAKSGVGKITKTITEKIGMAAAKSGFADMIGEQIMKVATKLSGLPFFKGASESMFDFGAALSDTAKEAVEKQSGKAAAKIGANILSTAAFLIKIATIAWDFEEGWNDASATLKVSNPTTGQKTISGTIRALKNLIPVVGMLIPDATIVDLFVKFVAPALGMDISDFKERRNQAEQELATYNEQNGTNYSWAEYTKQVKGNYTWGEHIGNGVKKVGSAIATGAKKVGRGIVTGAKFIFGGRSGSGLTGVSAGSSFISQLSASNRVKNIGFNNIGEKGCGPAAAAMANGDTNMNDAIADAGRYQTAGGTDAAFFGDYFGKKGKSTSYMNNTSDIARSITSGKPTVLMGRDSFNTSKANSPFGPNNHYVVANGIDSDGNLLINDPEQSHGNIKYDPSILNNVSLGIGVGAGSGLGRRKTNLLGLSAGGPTDQVSSNDSGKSTNSSSNSTGSQSMSRYQAIFQYLKGIGLSDIAAASIMGCWESESSNKPNRVEGDYLKSFPGSDKVLASPQAAQDYTTNILFPAYKKSNVSINKSAYKGTDGYYYPGVGIAAWTGPAASRLWDYTNGKGENWKTLAGQMDYFTNGPAKMSNTIESKMNSFGDTDTATTYFYNEYEMGGSNNHNSASLHPDWINQRKNSAKSILSKYGGQNNTLKLEDLKNVKLTDLNTTGGVATSTGGSYSSDSSSDSSSSSSTSSSTNGSSGGILSTIIGKFTTGLTNGIKKYTGIDLFGSSSEDSSTGSESKSNGTTSNSTGATGDGSYDNGSEYTPKNLGSGSDPVDYMESILGKIKYSMSGPRNPDKGSADCSSTVNWAIKKAGGPDTGGYTGAEQTNDNLYTVLNGKGATLTQDQLGGANYSKLKRNDMLLFTRDYAKKNPSTYPYGVGHVGLYMGDGKYIDHGSGMGPKIKPMPGTGLTQVRRLKNITWDKNTNNLDSNKDRGGMLNDLVNANSASGSGLTPSGRALLYYSAGDSGLADLATTANNAKNSYNNSNAGLLKQSSNIYNNSSSLVGNSNMSSMNGVTTNGTSRQVNGTIAKSNAQAGKVDRTTALMLKTIVTLIEQLVDNTSKVNSIYNVLSNYINNGGGSSMSNEQGQAILKAATTYTDTSISSQANTKTENELSSLKRTIDDILSA